MSAHAKPEENLEELRARWNLITGSEAEIQLRRLILLRELYHYLHKEQSRAPSARARSALLASLEHPPAPPRSWPDLDPETLRDLSGAPSPKSDLAHIRRLRLSALEARFKHRPEILERLRAQDRDWEAAITLEALGCHWNLWSMIAWIPTGSVGEFHRDLTRKIEPAGALLWMEPTFREQDFQAKWWIAWPATSTPPLLSSQLLQGCSPSAWNLEYPQESQTK